MKKVSKVVLIGLGSAALLGASVAFAAPTDVTVSATETAAPAPVQSDHHASRPQSMRESGGFFMQQLNQLDLTDEQTAQIEQIVTETRLAMAALGKSMRENLMALRALSNGESYDAEKVQQIAKQVGADTEQRVILQTETKHAIASVLTKEQRQTLKDSVKAAFQRHFVPAASAPEASS